MHFEYASWSFLVHFGVHLYFRSLANGKCFLVDGLASYVTAVLLEILLFLGGVGVIHPTCVFFNYNIGSLPIPNLLLSWCLVKFNRV